MARSPRASASSSVFIVFAMSGSSSSIQTESVSREDQHAALQRHGARQAAVRGCRRRRASSAATSRRCNAARRRGPACSGRRVRKALQRRLVGRQRIEPAHEDIEQAVARALALRRTAGEHRLVDAFRERRENGELAGEDAAQFGERHVGGGSDVGEANGHEAALGGERHQRIDDAVARLTGRRRSGLPLAARQSPACVSVALPFASPSCLPSGPI